MITMNVGLKKYLENIIGDNITRKIFFGKLSPGGLGQSGPDSDLDPRYSFQKMVTDLVRADWSLSGRLWFLLEGPKSVQCSEINFN